MLQQAQGTPRGKTSFPLLIPRNSAQFQGFNLSGNYQGDATIFAFHKSKGQEKQHTRTYGHISPVGGGEQLPDIERPLAKPEPAITPLNDVGIAHGFVFPQIGGGRFAIDPQQLGVTVTGTCEKLP